jgi:hypothetical protein
MARIWRVSPRGDSTSTETKVDWQRNPAAEDKPLDGFSGYDRNDTSRPGGEAA